MGILKNEAVEPDTHAMKQVAEAVGFDLPGTGVDSTEENVEALRGYFAERLEGVPRSEWVECPTCKECTDDDDRISLCPFCGDEGEGEDAGEEDNVDLAEGMEEKPEEEPVDLAELDEEPAQEPEEPPTADLSKEHEEECHEGESSETAMVPAQSGALSERLVVQKDKIVKGMKSMVKGSYDIGLALREIHDSELWKAEGHKHFRAFVASMKIGTTLAYDLIESVKRYDRKTFMDVGREKLMIVARAPEEKRSELLEKAKSGTSKRDLDKMAKEHKQKTAPAPEAPVEKDEKPPERGDSITLLAKVGGRPVDHSFKDRQTGESVDVWSPDSYGEYKISADVSLFIAMKTNDAGEIVGYTTAFRRAAEVATPEKEPAKKTTKKATKAKADKEPAKKTTKKATKAKADKEPADKETTKAKTTKAKTTKAKATKKATKTAKSSKATAVE